jgi:hypothetical protein
MSDQEQDAAVGRLVREYGESKRRLAAMNAELDAIKKAFQELVNGLGQNIAADSNLTVTRRVVEKTVLSQYDLTKLIKFLESFTELRTSMEQIEHRFLEFGIPLQPRL